MLIKMIGGFIAIAVAAAVVQSFPISPDISKSGKCEPGVWWHRRR